MNAAGMRDWWSAPHEGEHIWFLGALVTIKVPGEALDGRCTLIEFLIPQEASPPVHSHPADETFTMIDGTLTFVAGDERFLCEAGANWIVPRGVHHTFRVESETARLVAVTPLRAWITVFATPDSPPPPQPSRPRTHRLARFRRSKKRWRSTAMTTGARPWDPPTRSRKPPIPPSGRVWRRREPNARKIAIGSEEETHKPGQACCRLTVLKSALHRRERDRSGVRAQPGSGSGSQKLDCYRSGSASIEGANAQPSCISCQNRAI